MGSFLQSVLGVESNESVGNTSSHQTVQLAIYYNTWRFVYAVIVVPIIVGNFLIISSIIRFKELRCSSHIFIGNQAVSDMLVGILLIPYDVVGGLTNWNDCKYFCLVKLSLFVLCLGGSCFSLLLLSIERFAAIVFPIPTRHVFTQRRTLVIVSLGWVYVIANAILPVVGWNTYFDGQSSCISDQLWTRGYKLLTYWQLVITLVACVILYAVVMRVAMRKAKASKLRGQMYIHYKSSRDIQKLKTIIIGLGVFALFWFPYTSTLVVVTFYSTPVTRFVRRCTLLLGLINSAVNWIVHGWRNKEFRAGFKAIVRCKSRRTPRHHGHSAYVLKTIDISNAAD